MSHGKNQAFSLIIEGLEAIFRSLDEQMMAAAGFNQGLERQPVEAGRKLKRLERQLSKGLRLPAGPAAAPANDAWQCDLAGGKAGGGAVWR